MKQDLTRREVGILVPIAVCCLLLGVYPKAVTEVMEPALERSVLARVYDGQAGDAQWSRATGSQPADAVAMSADTGSGSADSAAVAALGDESLDRMAIETPEGVEQ